MTTTNYGRDTSCTTSLRTGRFVYGARLVAEAAFRRLTTPRGMLRGGEEESNYGLDLTERVGSTVTKEDVASLPGEISSELGKDERIEDVDVRVAENRSGPAIALDIEVDATTSEGPFTLQLRVTAVTVELVGLTVEDG